MALKKVEGSFVFGPKGADTGTQTSGESGISGVIATSKQRKYSSEVEVVGGDGELVDVVYSGPEETIVETKYESTFNHTDIGSGSYDQGIIIRRSIQYSNEDMAKTETEKIKKLS